MAAMAIRIVPIAAILFLLSQLYFAKLNIYAETHRGGIMIIYFIYSSSSELGIGELFV